MLQFGAVPCYSMGCSILKNGAPQCFSIELLSATVYRDSMLQFGAVPCYSMGCSILKNGAPQCYSMVLLSATIWSCLILKYNVVQWGCLCYSMELMIQYGRG